MKDCLFLLTESIYDLFDRAVDRIDEWHSIQQALKTSQYDATQQKKAVFQEVVLIEYPRKRCYVLGFLTSTAMGETQARTCEHIVNVFVPTTPNPTSGFLLLLPEEDITRLQMNIADGMKLIISGGAVVPDPKTGDVVSINNPTQAEGSLPKSHA